MKVKFLRQIRGGYGSFEAGNVADLSDVAAKSLIEAGAASAIEASDGSPETASLEQPEKAVSRTGKPRKVSGES